VPITLAQIAQAERQQWRAAQDTAAAIRLIAGPGTGKSATIEAVLAGTRSDSQCMVERSGFVVRRDQAAIIFSFAMGMASRKVCIGVLPKHQRP
jgi:hypothetical protein